MSRVKQLVAAHSLVRYGMRRGNDREGGGAAGLFRQSPENVHARDALRRAARHALDEEAGGVEDSLEGRGVSG